MIFYPNPFVHSQDCMISMVSACKMAVIIVFPGLGSGYDVSLGLSPMTSISYLSYSFRKTLHWRFFRLPVPWIASCWWPRSPYPGSPQQTFHCLNCLKVACAATSHIWRIKAVVSNIYIYILYVNKYMYIYIWFIGVPQKMNNSFQGCCRCVMVVSFPTFLLVVHLRNRK